MPKPHKLHLVILLAVAVVCLGAGAQYGRLQERAQSAAVLSLVPPGGEGAPAVTQPTPPPKETAPAMLAVHVKGAVENPGLYKLPEGSRVADALDEAGLLETANTDIINLAAELTDGMEVIIPFRADDEETDWLALAESNAPALLNANASADGSSGGGNSGNAAYSGPVNINTATLQQLQTLNGIGPAKAQAVIDYREQHGPFSRVEDIKKVSGIGNATFDKIKDRIVVE